MFYTDWTVFFMKWNKLILILLFAGTFCFGVSAAGALIQQQELSQKLVRLHVIANSDSKADQQIKMHVKDALWQELSEMNWQNKEELIMWFCRNKTEIQDICKKELEKNNIKQTVNVLLETERYDTRTQEGYTLPAGEYLSLKVVLGQGKGKNWWCVLYPNILRAGTEPAVQNVFSDDEISLMKQPGQVQVKLKLLELMNFLKIS